MVKQSFTFLILFLASVSLISFTSYNLLPANAIFELLVLTSFLLVSKRMSFQLWAIFLGLFFYVVYTMFAAKNTGAHMQDYFLAYKTFFYLIILCFFANKELFHKSDTRYLFRFLLAIFLAKYILWLLINSFERPGVFTENNFELMLLLYLSIAIFYSYGNFSRTEVVLLICIFFLSGSRSGLLALIATLCIFYIKNFDFKMIIRLFLLSLVAGVVVLIFISRSGGGGLDSIDRFVFLQGFLIATSNWEFTDYLFGSPPLTALPDIVCDRLTYYKVLFSAADPTKCYSVILHSYILRIVFDHGVLGLVFVCWLILFLLKCSGAPARARFASLMILILNGLSVSSLNSVYAMLGLIIVLSVSYKKDTGDMTGALARNRT